MAMGKSKLNQSSTRALQVLLVGGDDEDLALLRHRLTGENNGQLQIELAGSTDKAFFQLETKSCDLLLCSHKLGEDAALHLLREVRKHGSRVSIAFLSDPARQATLGATIRAVRRARASENHQRSAGALGGSHLAEKDYSDEHQRQKSSETIRQLSRAVEQSAELVIVADRLGTIEYVNPSFKALTGYGHSEAKGQPLEILRPREPLGEVDQEYWNAPLSGREFRGTVVHRKKSGKTFTLETVLTALRNPHGEIAHYVCTGRDMSDQRRLQSELQQSQKMDAIGRLAGGVAHDFNNLLLVISAYAELMLDSLLPEHPLRRNVTEIMTAARRAADLTRQLLAFGRRQVQALQVLDLNTAIGEVTGMLPHLVGEDVEVAFKPGQDLGKVKADPTQIEQIVMNLAANARDAMPRGGRLSIETATVQLDEAYLQRHSIVPPGDYVLLTVTDSGEGIAPEHLPHIFEPFYTTKEAGKGTGLGLATVYGIVKQNSGFVWVYSELGLGTTFKIYLPRIFATAGEGWTPRVEEDARGGWETLLLVEDEADVREPTRQFLERGGYTVLQACDGEDALQKSREHHGPIHLMITDVVMPRMGGPMLAGLLAGERPEMRALFVSGYAENTVLRHGQIDINSRFLQKPFSLKTLGRKVREVLEASELLVATTASGD